MRAPAGRGIFQRRKQRGELLREFGLIGEFGEHNVLAPFGRHTGTLAETGTYGILDGNGLIRITVEAGLEFKGLLFEGDRVVPPSRAEPAADVFPEKRYRAQILKLDDVDHFMKD